MRTEKFLHSIICDECHETILAGERHAVITVTDEDMLLGKKHYHLKHIYSLASQQMNKKFFQLDLFGG